MKSNPISQLCLSALFAITLGFSSVQTVATNAAGTWKWSFTTQGGETVVSTLDLKQDRDRLTGTFQGRLGGDTPIRDAKIQGNEISFAVDRQWQDRAFTLRFQGKLDGDKIVGTTRVGDGDRSFDWTAHREWDPTGTWKWTSTRRDGESRENTLVLKRSGESLTGSISGRLGGDLQIQEGKVEGNDLSFKVVWTGSQDRSFTANYKGTVKGDQIDGAIDFSFGDQSRTIDWTAKRHKTVDLTGAWDWSLTTPDGQTLSAVLKLNSEGQKLTGDLQGSDWELPLAQGQIDGDQVSFQTVRHHDGRSTVYNSKGRIAGDTLTGSVQFRTSQGEDRLYNWTAKKR